MSKTYLPYEPDQQLLLPAALQEWLPDDHLAYFISDVVDQLDMSKVTARYERERRGGDGEGWREPHIELRRRLRLSPRNRASEVAPSVQLGDPTLDGDDLRIEFAARRPCPRSGRLPLLLYSDTLPIEGKEHGDSPLRALSLFAVVRSAPLPA